MDERLIDEVLQARDAAFRPAEDAASSPRSGRLTARERIGALVDEGSFVEYGVLAEANPDDPGAAPADGVIAGVGRVWGEPVTVAAYDPSVLDGTQSDRNTRKLARMVNLANTHRWPCICFIEGAGARPDQPREGPAISIRSQSRWGVLDGLAELSGWAPTVAVLTGTALDGHVAIAMLCDCIVATRGARLGSRGGGGVELEPHDAEAYARHGDLDLIVADDAAAAAAARRYLHYWLVTETSGEPAAGADGIADIVPAHRRRPYDMRKILNAFADAGSVLELRPDWAPSMITAFARLDGRAIGIFANQPRSPLAGAIDADAADKAARFVELCDAYGLPLVSFIDNPGYMVGPQAEAAGIARHHARPLAALQHRSVPLYSVQIRKAYGLGPYAMSGYGNSNLTPDLRLAWPSVESGGMSLEGAAYLVRRKEIQAAKSTEEALAIRNEYAEQMRDLTSGLRAGRTFSFDDIIAPAETRARISAMLQATSRRRPDAKTHPIDPV